MNMTRTFIGMLFLILFWLFQSILTDFVFLIAMLFELAGIT